MMLRTRVVPIGALVGAALVTLSAATTSRPEADAFAKKVAIINQHGELGSGDARRTRVTENELNSWFAFRAKPVLPEGISDPKVTIIGEGKVLGGATVDLEAIGKRRGTSGSNVLSYLGGRVPLTVSGILHTEEGKGRFELQAAEVSGLPVPTTLLQELLSYYTRTPERPQGRRLDEIFELPAGIKKIEVGQGQAVVVQ